MYYKDGFKNKTSRHIMRLAPDWSDFVNLYGGLLTSAELLFAKRQAEKLGIEVKIVRSDPYGNDPPEDMENTRKWDMAADVIFDFIRDSRKSRLSDDILTEWLVFAFHGGKSFATLEDKQLSPKMWSKLDDISRLLLVKGGFASVEGTPTREAFMLGARIKS